jgi:ankyrin repeat protein
MDQFKYDPIGLDGCSFRLLQLCFGKEGPIECYLFDARLDSIIEYDALSYTWGSSIQPYEICVNNSTMPVTANLSQALRDLRYPDRDRLLWVDAICINQEDLKERGHQVEHMASIYKRAEQVIVWLGRPTLATDLVFRYMCQLEKLTIEHAYHDWKVTDQRWQDLWSAVKPLVDDDSTNWLLQQRHAFESILSRPWFQRVWIIQEVANARSARIMCGTATVSAAVFAVTPLLLDVQPDPHCQAILNIMPGPSRKYSWWTQDRTLHMLLLKFRWSKASDPRDAIYALLGISSDAYSTKYLVPNYELSVKEVVHNTLAFLLSFGDEEIPMQICPRCKSMPEFLNNLDLIGGKLLSWAFETGNVAMASRLFDLYGFDREELGIDEEVLLRSAARNGHKTIARHFHDRGNFNMNARDEHGKTLVFKAAMKGDEMLLRLLLDTGRAEVNAEDKDGLTPLAVAIHYKQHAAVKLLVESIVGANTAGNSASELLDLAIRSDQAAIVHLLVRALAVDTIARKEWIKAQLFRAAESGDHISMEILLGMDETNLDAKDGNGQILLMAAARNGHARTVQLLVEIGKVDVRATDHNGQTPLLVAARSGHENVVEFLLKIPRIDVSVTDGFGNSTFSLAVKRGDEEMVALLLDSGKFDPNKQDSDKRTPLILAVQENHQAVVELLLRKRIVDVNVKDNRKRTPLSWAAEKGNRSLVHRLLATGKANVSHKDREGLTPLSWAARYGHLGVIQELLETGKADTSSRDSFGKTALMWAGENGHERVVQVLRSYSAHDRRNLLNIFWLFFASLVVILSFKISQDYKGQVESLFRSP